MHTTTDPLDRLRLGERPPTRLSPCHRRRDPGRTRRVIGLLAGLALALAGTSPGLAQQGPGPVTLLFEGSGDEDGVTERGATDFTHRGSTWTGGVVETEGILSLYASGLYSYEIGPDGGSVSFDPPVTTVDFFYVHGFRFAAGTATALDAAGDVIATADSLAATRFGDPDNFVRFETEAPIARIEFSSGVIDDFTYGGFVEPEPDPIAPLIELGDLEITLVEVTTAVSSPVVLTHAGDGSGRLFIVDQIGLVRIVDASGALLDEPFLDLRDRMITPDPGFDERGLLGLAFHPEYADNGRLFIRYSAPRDDTPGDPCAGTGRGCHREVLAEFSVSTDDPNAADPTSERILLEVDEPEFNHNAGHIAFGPDGLLYVSFGDGGGRDDGLSNPALPHGPGGHGQNLETPLGALHRIDVDAAEEPFGVPADNPFVETDGLDSIWAYGFRNPYRFSFDRGGDRELLVADVGQGLLEELDVVEGGGNYGWVVKEGSICFDPEAPDTPLDDCDDAGLIDPIAEYGHDDGLAIVGGHVYRGDQSPDLAGKYIFGDFSTGFGSPAGRLFWIDMDADRSVIRELRLTGREALDLYLLGFGEDEDGELYVLTSSSLGPLGDDGQVWRVTSPDVPPTGGLRAPGDCNSDGGLDISDAVCLLGALFLGNPTQLPCGSGAFDAPGNVALLDWQDDGGIDLSDAVSALNFLFAAGPPHALLATVDPDGCVEIEGCPDACP